MTCTASDGAGNIGYGSFTVLVKGAAGQLTDLLAQVAGVGPGNSLSAKVQIIQAKVAAGDQASACGALGAFVNEVKAQTGKKISPLQASQLIAVANNIKATFGC